jgi:hypothetical protein
MSQSEKQKQCHAIAYKHELGQIYYRDYGHNSKNRTVDKREYWADDDTLKKDNPRPCFICKKYRVKRMDACIVNLPNVKYACCGHGIEGQGYVVLFDGRRLEFDEYIKEFNYFFDEKEKIYIQK